MQTVETHGSFEDAISKSDAHVQALARSLRELIADVHPGVVEVPWPKQQIVGYGIGPKKMSEHYCYIAVLREHVNIGFNYGAVLPDPEHLLEGTGKAFRHVKILSIDEVKRPPLRKLMEAAVKEREKVLSLMK
jgi:hypothetical protein